MQNSSFFYLDRVDLSWDRLARDARDFDLTGTLNPRFMTAMTLIGIAVSVKQLWRPVHGFYRHWVRPRRDLKSRYGGNWALVTGASSGIGEAICYELAKSGFNIILLSEDHAGLESVAEKARTRY